MRILLAGATGQVGRRVLERLRLARHDVRALAGSELDLTIPDAARDLAMGCDVVVSCAGASVSLRGKERRGYLKVDPVINGALLKEALHAGVKRFLYLGVHAQPAYAHTAYVRAHEMFVDRLRQSSMSFTVVRPTGIFSAFSDLLPMARCGFVPLIGNGQARTNPIDPDDVADILMAHLASGPAEVACGWPEILSRADINRVVARSVGKWNPFLPSMPAGIVNWEAKAMRMFHPRIADLMEFFSLVATNDCIAPALGRRRLDLFFPPQTLA